MDDYLPVPAPAPAPASPYPCDVSAAQLGEIWAAATDDEAIALLARCLQLPGDFDEEARTSIWVEMLYKWLDFGKVSEMNVTKALAVMRIMVSLHVHAVGEPPPPPPSPSLRASDALILCHLCHRLAETMCSKPDAYGFFTDSLLTVTKALPPAERFTLPEVKLLTEFVDTNYLACIKLHQLVFNEEQTVRSSHVELFLQTPAVPPATSSAVDPDTFFKAPAPAPAPTEPEPEQEPEPEPEPPPKAPTLEDEALAAAIAATIEEQVAALKHNMAAEYAAQEREVLDRIAQLEARVK